MIYRPLGRTGMNISPIVYGGIVSMSDGQDNSDAYVEYAIRHGINYFDVAPSYGDAEEKLGRSLIPYRKDIYLACKTQERTAEGAKRELEHSLKQLHTDYFDNYQMHSLSTMEDLDTAFGENGAMSIMIRAKEQGLVRNLGITCHSEEVALRALTLYDFDTVLFPLNWGLHLAKGFGGRIAAAAKDKGIGLLAMKAFIHRAWIDHEECLKSGFHKSWCKPIINDERFLVAAMKYTLSLGADTLVPPGNFHHFSFAVEHIDECLEHPLTQEDLEYLTQRLPEIQGHYFF